jgi:hypothetical protein
MGRWSSPSSARVDFDAVSAEIFLIADDMRASAPVMRQLDVHFAQI